MKALTCEMCGSTNLIKEDGVFVCQSCGTKYSVEEARKMMVEGTVDVKGTVKIDTSSELQNLYEVARRAKDSDNNEQAEKYYDQILVKDPSSWEANFYVVYFKAMSCRIIEITSAANSISNCIAPVMELVKKNIQDDKKQADVINEIYLRCNLIAQMFFGGSKSHLDSMDWEIRGDYKSEHVGNGFAALQIYLSLASSLREQWEDKYEKVEADCCKDAADMYVAILESISLPVEEDGFNNLFGEHLSLIQKYYPDYEPGFTTKRTSMPSHNNSSGGCYVATAVYGSYDCPEVWTLRRFRDFTLDNTWHGRLFIKSYYAISPALVRWFGHTRWFKKLWRGPLDKLVANLNNKGVAASPYQDKY